MSANNGFVQEILGVGFFNDSGYIMTVLGVIALVRSWVRSRIEKYKNNESKFFLKYLEPFGSILLLYGTVSFFFLVFIFCYICGNALYIFLGENNSGYILGGAIVYMSAFASYMSANSFHNGNYSFMIFSGVISVIGSILSIGTIYGIFYLKLIYEPGIDPQSVKPILITVIALLIFLFIQILYSPWEHQRLKYYIINNHMQ